MKPGRPKGEIDRPKSFRLLLSIGEHARLQQMAHHARKDASALVRHLIDKEWQARRSELEEAEKLKEITDEVMRFWKQNPELTLEDIRSALSKEPKT